jgi:multidrug efflux pump subunit AcrA (membrane-fusion protein)
LLVPADAVQGSSIYLVDGNVVRKREVEVGIRGTRAVEILSGLKESERVASPAGTDLADGRRVRVVDKKPAS